jgi:hypothetical protein
MKTKLENAKRNASGILAKKAFLLINLTVIAVFFLLSCKSGNKTTTPEWRQLFNGKDLTGWQQVGPGSHYVEDSLLKSKGGMGLLVWTGEKFQDCIIRVVFAMRDSNSNSGVFIRIPTMPTEEWMPVNKGYEVQIDNNPQASGEDDYHYTGMLYSLTKPLAKTGKPGPQWNTMEITLAGPRTIVYLNGVKVTDFKEGDPVPEKKFDFEPDRGPRPISGYIGIQNHSDADVVFFKEVAERPLTKEELKNLSEPAETK